MTDEELIASLRGKGFSFMEKAADRIEALTAERDDYAFKLADANNTYSEMHVALNEANDKLATCEKYRDAYAECDSIGTQAVRDLEAKLAKAVEAISNVVEEYDLFRKNEYERGLSPLDDEIHEARTTLAEIDGEKG
jgi:predicted  nucleic acid-binding Zn-ribbon protein